MGGETPIDWVFTIEHSTWDVGAQHELASWSLRFIHLNLINLTSESYNGGSHGVEDIWKNKQLWKGLQRRSRVKSRKLNKTLHFLANPASSSIKWQNLNSSNLRERSLGGGGSIRLPGQELSWGELLSFCVFFVCLGGAVLLDIISCFTSDLIHTRSLSYHFHIFDVPGQLQEGGHNPAVRPGNVCSRQMDIWRQSPSADPP